MTRHEEKDAQLELRPLLEAIEAQYGVDLRNYAQASLARRVDRLSKLHGLTLEALQARVLREPAFFADFLDYVMIRVTEFFRDPQFFLAFRREVVPVLRTYPLLRIWHAGCATGEEVYSTAMLLAEEGLYERAQLYGTDVSAEAIERAKAGIYPANLAAQYAENHQKSGGTVPFSNYYSTGYDHLVVRESLKKNILFFQHDLVADQVFGEMQAVFCRNVLIYFDRELKGRVLDKLSSALCHGGFLCLGGSESVPAQGHGENSEGRIVDLAPRERIFRRAG